MKKSFLPALLLILILLPLVSCVQEAGTATMHILLYQEEKSLSVSESAFDITKYTVTGTGPGGAAFTADTTSTSLVLEGLQTGSWSLTAKAYNSKGKVVASGEASAVLSGDSSNVSLPVCRVSGTGKLVLSFKWDETVLEPMVRVTLTDTKDNVVGVYDTSYSTSSGTFKLTNLKSGYYVVLCELYSATARITGAVEAIQISGSETTEGSISFCSKGDYSSSFYIARTGESPVRGQLSGNSSTLKCSESCTVSLTLTGSSLAGKQTEVRWFLDGVETSATTETFTFTPTLGYHIVNALLLCPSDGLAGSTGWKFNAVTEGTQGSAVLNGTIDGNSSNLTCNASSLLGAVGEDRYVIICPDKGLLQLVKVYNSTLIVEKVYRDTDEGFSWLGLSDHIYSSAGMAEFAVTDSGCNINLLYVENGEVHFCTKDAQAIRFTATVPAFSETICALDIGWVDPGNRVIGFSCFAEAFLLLTFEDGVLVKQGRYVKPRHDNLVVMASTFGSLSVCAVADGSYYSCAFANGRFSGTWTKSGVSLSYCQPVELTASSGIAEASKGNLSLWTPGSRRWICKSSSDVLPISLSRSYDGKFLYATDASGKLTTYSISDSGMRKISILDTGERLTSLIVGKQEILGRKENGELLLFSIAGGVK